MFTYGEKRFYYFIECSLLQECRERKPTNKRVVRLDGMAWQWEVPDYYERVLAIASQMAHKNSQLHAGNLFLRTTIKL